MMKECFKEILRQPYVRVCFANPLTFGLFELMEKLLLLLPSRFITYLVYPVTSRYRYFFGTSEEYVIYSDLFGTMIVDKKEPINSHLYYFKLWEPAITQVILNNLSKDDIFIDIGANIGYYSLIAARRCQKVLSFEASPSIFEKLRRNVALNNLSNVDLHNCAILDKLGKVHIHLGNAVSRGMTSIFAQNYTNFEAEIEAKPLSAYLDNNVIKKIKIIKIDVEGAESLVLKDIFSILDQLPQQVIFSLEIIAKNLMEKFNTDPQTLLQPFIAAEFRFFLVLNVYALGSYLYPKKFIKFQELSPSELNQALFENNDLIIARKNIFEQTA